MALSDHASVDNCINFQDDCIKNDIIPIAAVELYVTSYDDFKGKSGHVCLFAKNEVGWRNILNMLSIANLKHFYRRPKIDFNILYEFCEGTICSTACAGSFLNLDKSEEFFNKLHSKMKDDLYLEIMPHHLDAQDSINKKCLELNKKTGVKLVTSCDSHYVNKEDHIIHDVLLCIQTKTTMDDPNRFRFKFEGSYLQSWDEILENYATRGIVDEKTAKKSLFNTLEIAEKCKDFRIKKRDISLPDFRPYPQLSPKQNLKKLYTERAEKRLGFKLSDNKEYLDRARMEYEVITEKNFETYFLIVQDFLEWCRNQGWTPGPGRGSAAGSLISYILGITEIDPIRHGLIFERFLNRERASFPDIDIDIPKHRREEARQYLIDKYGKNNVAGVSTFSYLKGKSVIRDVSRVFGIPLEEVDIFAKSLEDKGEDLIKNAIEKTEEGRAFASKYPKIVEYAQKLEGTVRGCGQHASAVVVSKEDLTKSGQCNLSKRSGHIVVNWDMHDAEDSGLMKLDLLGLSQLSIVDETFKLIKETEGKEYNIRSFLDVDDQQVFKELSKGNTAGIFQMNTRTMTDYIKKLGISCFEDMSACVALVRPGASDSGIADEYLLRKHGKTWEKRHPIYDDITKETLNLIPYQEQIMFMFTRLAGLSFVIADNIRKIIGKKRDVREFDQYKDMFVNGCLKEKTFTKDEALQFWTELEASANYLFNKSHSVSYAFLSYVTAWLKIHYPSHFYCANLTMGEDDKKGSIIKEAYDYGLSIKLPKVGYSKASTWTVNDNILLAPFSEIKGLGEKQAIEASLEIPQKFKPFSGFYSTPERSKNETKIKKLLTTIGSWDYNEKPKLEVQELFEFPISNDLEVIGKTLLDLCKKKYSEEIIYKIFNGKKYPEIKLIQNVERDFYEFECNGCSLNGNPFETVFGDKNLMIITEHPSYSDANQNNKLFSCNVANEVLMDLYDIGVNYEDLTIACCTKCFPGKGKKPIDEQKNACAKHLEKEIFHAKPKIILALGRISVEFFNPEARASEFYGKFIWSERYKSFIFYGYSTGFAYIGQENKMKFKKSLKKFYEMVKRNL
jgi:DNA polymerase-3 subunit alpha